MLASSASSRSGCSLLRLFLLLALLAQLSAVLVQGQLSSSTGGVQPYVGGPTLYGPANQALLAGQYLQSSNGQYRFLVTQTGDLQVVRTSDGVVVYDFLTATATPFLIMQADCNLVLYSDTAHSSVVYATGTNNDGSNCSLVMQDDGNLVVYSNYGGPYPVPLFFTMTIGSSNSGAATLYGPPRQYLLGGQFLQSANGFYELLVTLAGDIQLVDTRTNTVVKDFNTATAQPILAMQADCNLVLYNTNSQTPKKSVFATGTDRQGYNCTLVLQDDRNLVIYNDYGTPTQQILYASNTVVAIPPPSSSTGPASAVSDPRLVGFWGQSFFVSGAVGGVYNLLSDATVQVNAYVVQLSHIRCPTIDGHTMERCWDEAGVYYGVLSVRVQGGVYVRLTGGSYDVGFQSVSVDDRRELQVGDVYSQAEQGGHTAALTINRTHSHRLQLTAGLYSLTIDSVDLYVDVTSLAASCWTCLTDTAQPDGLLGRT